MIVTADHFKSTAHDYITSLNVVSDQLSERITNSLIQTISSRNIREIPKQDFDMLVNQFFNLVCFGPITNLEIFLTENCNLACDYCFVREKHHNKMPLDTVYAAINFLVFYSGNATSLNLTLFGGEPLMEKETIYRIVDYCNKIENDTKAKNIGISLTTNGTLLDEDILKRTAGKINYLLSIDGAKETHDLSRKYRNGKGTFNTIISKIDLLKRHQPWLGARMTVTPDTISKLFDNVKFLHNRGINQFLLGPTMDMIWDKASLENYEDQIQKVSQFYNEQKQAGEPIRITLFEKNEQSIECHTHQWGCGAGRNTISVSTNGDIYPCSKFLGYEEFDNPALKLGNIFEGITNIDLRSKMSGLTDNSFPGCSSCAEINACIGGCPADNFYLNQNLHKPGTANCELKKIENRILRKMHKE